MATTQRPATSNKVIEALMPALDLDGRRVISIKLDAAWNKFLEVEVRLAPTESQAEALVAALESLKTDADA